jgi:predicted nucleic acid-binding protein
MNVFVDANVLVSVLNKEYPLFTYTSRIVSLANSNEFKIFTSPVCLAIAFYFAEKKYRSATAKQKIALLCNHIEIAEVSTVSVKKCLQNPAVKDFEDGLEYYAALESGCHCIVTEDTGNFYFSRIEVLNSHDFYLKHMAKKK